MRLQIEKLIYGGFGLGHDKKGRAVFVRKTVPLDELEVEVVAKKKSYSEATIKEIIQAGPDRIAAPCPYFGWCGGCDYQCLSYDNQLKVKSEIFTETLLRQGIGVKPEPILRASEQHLEGVGTPSTFEVGLRYRNNNRFFFILHDDLVEFGRHNFVTETPAPVGECLLQSDRLNQVLGALKKYINDNIEDKKPFWQLKVREGIKTGEILVEIITQNPSLPGQEGIVETLKSIPGVKSIYHTVTNDKSLLNLRRRLIFGSPIIYDKIGRFTFQISPESFFQVNTLGAETLYNLIKQYADIKPGQNILDLYCGTGTIGIYLSTLAKKVIGIESVPEAVNDAMANAKINRVHNCEFICADVEKHLLSVSNAYGSISTIIVDPPRAGLSPNIIDSLSHLVLHAPRNSSEAGLHSRPSALPPFRPKIIYVSCDPSTFARDVVRFKEKGIELQKVQPVDMFPQTHHIECVGLLLRQQLE